MAPPIKICRFGFGGGETLRGVFALRSPVAAGADLGAALGPVPSGRAVLGSIVERPVIHGPGFQAGPTSVFL